MQKTLNSNTIYNIIEKTYKKTNHYGIIIDTKENTIKQVICLGENIPKLEENWTYYTTYYNKIYLSNNKTII